jgi:hypothetical protein
MTYAPSGNVLQDFSLSTATNLFKINYYEKSENMYNSANVLLGRVKKKYDFTGRQRFIATPLSFAGGVGSGSLPTAGVATYSDALIVAKKVYATCEIDREAMKASSDDAGAFVRATKEVVQKCVESYLRNASRIMFGDGSGLLGRGAANGAGDEANVSGAGSSGSPYVVQFPVATWNEANFEEKDLVQVVTGLAVAPSFIGGTAEATFLVISAVDPANRKVSLVGTSARLATLSGSGPLAVTDGIALQNSYLNDPQGLQGVLNASIAGTGTLYNIAVQRRWSMTFKDASGAGLITDMMNEVMLEVERKFGKAPKLIVTSYTQYRKLLNLLEDHKRYNLPARAEELKGMVSFSGVEFMSTRGSIGVFADRFCPASQMYFLNDDFIEVHHRPGFGWFDDDGTVFLRTSGDSYEARYGGYYDNYITPTAHGCLYGLAI